MLLNYWVSYEMGGAGPLRAARPGKGDQTMSQATMLIEEVARPVVRQTMVFQGLCRDCSRAEACTFPRDPSRAVRSCEEFEAPEPARGRNAPLECAVSVFSVASEPAAETGELGGLCRQCAQRLTCQFPKPPEGVWQCDELA
jgi:hypothetical protein